MKFSFIEPHLETYGGIRRIVELSNSLIRRGHRVVIYHPAGKPCAWLNCLAETKRLAAIAEDRHEVLIYNYPPQHGEFCKVKARLKVYYILHAHHLYCPKEIVIPTYRQQGVLKIACSQWVNEQVKVFVGKDLPVVYGGVNKQIFHPVPGRPKEVDVVFYGGKRPWKGTDTILESCRLGNFSHDGYEGKNLKQSQMADFICKGRVFVSGSWFEGWNNCSLEAMACGIPVVTTDCGGNREFALDGVTALVVPIKDAHRMAQQIARLLSDPGLSAKIAARGYEKAQEFDWEKSAEEWERVIGAALKRTSLKRGRLM